MAEVLVLNNDGTPLSLVPLSTVSWREAITDIFKGKAASLKDYEHWKVRSEHLTINVPSIIMMKEQVKFNKKLNYSKGNVYLRDDYTCQLQITSKCRAIEGKVKHTELTIDHIIPRSQGGFSTWLNVCTACKDCNWTKGNDETIIPKKSPYKPTYYEILAKRKNFPVQIHDLEWKYYLDFNEELLHYCPLARNQPK